MKQKQQIQKSEHQLVKNSVGDLIMVHSKEPITERMLIRFENEILAKVAEEVDRNFFTQ